MAAPTRLDNTAYLYFTGSFAAASGTATLFISGTGNVSSGAMPLFIQAKEEKSSTIPLYLSAIAKTSSWESLGNPWASYNIQCSIGAPNYCQDWEYIPYTAAQATGLSKTITMYASGAYRGRQSGCMPLYIYSSGDGVGFSSMPLYLYAANTESSQSGIMTVAMSGHDIIDSNITMSISGENPNASGLVTMFCQSYEQAYETIKLFVSGI